MAHQQAKLLDFEGLLFDIDRTLTNFKKEISPKTINVLHKLGEMNLKIGVCSGRGVAGIKNKILPLFPNKSIHIVSGGAQLVNSSGELIWDHPIDAEIVKTIKKYIQNSNLEPVFMKQDALYASGVTLSHLKSDSWKVVNKDLELMSDDGVESIYVSNINQKFLNYLENKPLLSFKKMVGNSGNQYVDITAKGINKATALKQWSKETRIPPKKIIGFGDSINDLEFLEACGFSVVMGNGVKQLKKVADRVIGHTDKNALAKYLLKVIEGGNL